jgi:hypothetical protein
MAQDLMKLNTFAAVYQTDKLGHGYLPYYAEHLPTKCKTLLEVGAFKGASLKLWKELYPKASISCFDLFQDPDNISKEAVEAMGIKAYQGDQGYPNDLNQIEEMFDVIIEDGSHRSDHQIITFETLWPKVKSGGVYIVEDLHCCNDRFYWAGFVHDFKDTLLHLCQRYEQILPDTFWGRFDDIDNVKLYDNKIAFIFKK